MKGDKFAALRSIYGFKKVETPSKILKKLPIMCFARIKNNLPLACKFIQPDTTVANNRLTTDCHKGGFSIFLSYPRFNTGVVGGFSVLLPPHSITFRLSSILNILNLLHRHLNFQMRQRISGFPD